MTQGRAFLRRLIDLTRGACQPYHKVRITRGAREDLRAWLAFLRRFSGTVMRSAIHWTDNSALRFYTDASGSIGFGIYFAGKWAQGRWPPHVLEKKYSIAFLEFLPIVVGVQVWGEHVANRRSCFARKIYIKIMTYLCYPLKCCSPLAGPENTEKYSQKEKSLYPRLPSNNK